MAISKRLSHDGKEVSRGVFDIFVYPDRSIAGWGDSAARIMGSDQRSCIFDMPMFRVTVYDSDRNRNLAHFYNRGHYSGLINSLYISQYTMKEYYHG